VPCALVVPGNVANANAPTTKVQWMIMRALIEIFMVTPNV